MALTVLHDGVSCSYRIIKAKPTDQSVMFRALKNNLKVRRGVALIFVCAATRIFCFFLKGGCDV